MTSLRLDGTRLSHMEIEYTGMKRCRSRATDLLVGDRVGKCQTHFHLLSSRIAEVTLTQQNQTMEGSTQHFETVEQRRRGAKLLKIHFQKLYFLSQNTPTSTGE